MRFVSQWAQSPEIDEDVQAVHMQAPTRSEAQLKSFGKLLLVDSGTCKSPSRLVWDCLNGLPLSWQRGSTSKQPVSLIRYRRGVGMRCCLSAATFSGRASSHKGWKTNRKPVSWGRLASVRGSGAEGPWSSGIGGWMHLPSIDWQERTECVMRIYRAVPSKCPNRHTDASRCTFHFSGI